MVEGLTIAVAVAVAGVLVYWFVFRWKATPKRWCVMLYLTSNTPASAATVNGPEAETGIPNGAPLAATLDQKLDQVVNAIRSLPCSTDAGIAANPEWGDVHVVYRAVWDDPSASPEARVVSPKLSAPKATYFPGETVIDVGYAIDFTRDLTLFFEWAYDNCPAEHYAVFFWGHAMGPAGFFQPSEKPVVVSPLLALLMKVVFFLTGSRWTGNLGIRALSDTIGSIVQQRLKDGGFDQRTKPEAAPTVAVPPADTGVDGDSGAPIVFTAGQVVPKVDVVLFQDCWMATLETAFELQDDVRYIVSSQSLVPAGFAPGSQLGAVWPYKDLIATFLNQSQPNFAAPMMTVLNDFFNGTGRPAGTPIDYNRYPATKVLFSLVDCGSVAGAISSAIKADYRALVKSLYALGSAKRSDLIERRAVQAEKSGRLYELSGTALKVGDQALIDIITFCAYLQLPAQWPATVVVTQQERNAIVAAAAALQAKVTALITCTFQSPARVPGDFTYTGTTALYKPFGIWGDDPYIMSAFRSSYETLRFSKETRVTPSPGATECSWTEYGFERYSWF